MSLPKELKELFTTDYTEMYRPPLRLPETLTDEFHKVILFGDAAAIKKYYCKTILSYCYSADLERELVKKWNKETSSKCHRENGAMVSESIKDSHKRWQDEADDMWERKWDRSKPDVAQCIAEYEDRSWLTIRKYIKKNK